MKFKKIFGWILKVPLILLNLGGLVAGAVMAKQKINNMSWAGFYTLVGVFAAYLIGVWLIKSSREQEEIETSTDDATEQ